MEGVLCEEGGRAACVFAWWSDGRAPEQCAAAKTERTETGEEDVAAAMQRCCGARGAVAVDAAVEEEEAKGGGVEAEEGRSRAFYAAGFRRSSVGPSVCAEEALRMTWLNCLASFDLGAVLVFTTADRELIETVLHSKVAHTEGWWAARSAPLLELIMHVQTTELILDHEQGAACIERLIEKRKEAYIREHEERDGVRDTSVRRRVQLRQQQRIVDRFMEEQERGEEVEEEARRRQPSWRRDGEDGSAPVRRRRGGVQRPQHLRVGRRSRARIDIREAEEEEEQESRSFAQTLIYEGLMDAFWDLSGGYMHYLDIRERAMTEAAIERLQSDADESARVVATYVLQHEGVSQQIGQCGLVLETAQTLFTVLPEALPPMQYEPSEDSATAYAPISPCSNPPNSEPEDSDTAPTMDAAASQRQPAQPQPQQRLAPFFIYPRPPRDYSAAEPASYGGATFVQWRVFRDHIRWSIDHYAHEMRLLENAEAELLLRLESEETRMTQLHRVLAVQRRLRARAQRAPSPTASSSSATVAGPSSPKRQKTASTNA